jgi:hypothetical protein
MRLLILPAAAAALAAAISALPAEAASHRHQRHHPSSLNGAYGAAGRDGYGTGPYWQGEPTDNLPIWRNGYYQGNDPDPFIRSQLMRDPTNGDQQ